MGPSRTTHLSESDIHEWNKVDKCPRQIIPEDSINSLIHRAQSNIIYLRDKASDRRGRITSAAAASSATRPLVIQAFDYLDCFRPFVAIKGLTDGAK